MLLLLSVVAPFESEECDEPVGFVAIVESEEPELSDEPDGSPGFAELEAVEVSDVPEGSLGMIELAVTNLTASAHVDSELELETMTTFAVPEKGYEPMKIPLTAVLLLIDNNCVYYFSPVINLHGHLRVTAAIVSPPQVNLL